MPTAKTKNPGNVQVIERGCKILNHLAQGRLSHSIHDLSREVGLPKPTVHRILATLRNFGFVTQDESSKEYRLGFRLVELGQIVLDQIDLRKVAKPFLTELAGQVEEVVHLVIMEQGKIAYLDKVEKVNELKSLRMVSRIGMRSHAHSCAVGKVLLSFLPENERAAIFKQRGLPRMTKNTMVDPVLLNEHLAKVKVQGYAVDDAENEEGVRCVAAPVRNDQGRVMAAISVSGPSVRMTKERIHGGLKNQVIQTALKISRTLGYRPVA
jgi:DNA-binding IclR family transcriptional regulator